MSDHLAPALQRVFWDGTENRETRRRADAERRIRAGCGQLRDAALLIGARESTTLAMMKRLDEFPNQGGSPSGRTWPSGNSSSTGLKQRLSNVPIRTSRFAHKINVQKFEQLKQLYAGHPQAGKKKQHRTYLSVSAVARATALDRRVAGRVLRALVEEGLLRARRGGQKLHALQFDTLDYEAICTAVRARIAKEGQS